LPELDRRERNYLRVEVTRQIDVGLEGQAWTYLGRPEAVQRFEHGARSRRAVVDKTYLDCVRSGFGLLSDGALEEFDASTDPPGCAVLELQRIELDQ
jgi:hypothetical protein